MTANKMIQQGGQYKRPIVRLKPNGKKHIDGKPGIKVGIQPIEERQAFVLRLLILAVFFALGATMVAALENLIFGRWEIVSVALSGVWSLSVAALCQAGVQKECNFQSNTASTTRALQLEGVSAQREPAKKS